jgi:hypothetical protein
VTPFGDVSIPPSVKVAPQLLADMLSVIAGGNPLSYLWPVAAPACAMDYFLVRRPEELIPGLVIGATV